MSDGRKLNLNELREPLAALSHEIWAHWMTYLFHKCYYPTNAEETIPEELAERWHMQITTPYADLTEREKDSDREQADKILELLRNSL